MHKNDQNFRLRRLSAEYSCSNFDKKLAKMFLLRQKYQNFRARLRRGTTIK